MVGTPPAAAVFSTKQTGRPEIVIGREETESQNHTIIKVGKDLQDHQVQLPTQHHHAC